MATHSSILAWRIPWMEEPGGQQSTGLQSQTWLSDFTWFTFSRYHICTQARTNTHPLEAAIAHNAFDWPLHQRLTWCPGWVSELPRVVGRNQWRKRLEMCLGLPVRYPSTRGVLLVFSTRILCIEGSQDAQTCMHMHHIADGLNITMWWKVILALWFLKEE